MPRQRQALQVLHFFSTFLLLCMVKLYFLLYGSAESSLLRVTYSYITRLLSTSPLSLISEEEPEYNAAKQLVSKLVPFLTDRRSKVVLSSLSGLITDLWSRFDIVS
jgi:hypothetical protein